MEASGVMFNQPTCVSYPGLCREPTPSSLSAGKACLYGGRRSLVSGFRDNGHLQYYSFKNGSISGGSRVCMAVVRDENATSEKAPVKMVKKKKQIKFLKSLSRDLSTFSQIGFGLDLDTDRELLHRVKSSTVSEASEILLERIQKLKAEEKDSKRKMKEEKKRLKAAARTKTRLLSGEMSSSSSSESSDSDCVEVVDMNNLRTSTANQDSSKPVTLQDAVTSPPPSQIPQSSPVLALNHDLKETSTPDSLNSQNIVGDVSATVAAITPGKVEVCMGGKCKKSGAAALLEEFQKAIGGEGAVTGCKCMGKCRDGPNVRVVSSASEPADRNPLCIGVGLDDVNMIVANFLGEERNQISLAPSC